MSAPATTTRLRGKKAVLHFGDTAGASDVWNSALLDGVDVDLTRNTVDMSAMDDDWDVNAVGRGSGTLSCKHLTTGDHDVRDKIIAGEACYIAVYEGIAEGSTATLGDLLLVGLFIPTSWKTNLSDSKQLDDCQFKLTGEPDTTIGS